MTDRLQSPPRRFASRLDAVRPSASMSLNERAAALRAAGHDIVNLTIGQPDFDTPDAIKKAAADAIAAGHTQYTDSRGIATLRCAIADMLEREHGAELDPETEILVTPGAKQGIYYLAAALLDENSEAIVFEPYWLSYLDIVRLCGGRPVPVVGHRADGYKPSVDAVRAAVSSNTRMLMFSNPCNPTGATWNEAEIGALVELADDVGAVLVADEVYERLAFDPACSSVAASESLHSHAVMVGSFSKGHAMTGWRIGWLAGPADLIERVQILQQQTATCPSSISQHAAIRACALQTREMVDSYRQRRDNFIPALNSIDGLACTSPGGGFYAWVDISALGIGSVEFAEILLNEAHVACVPGIAYGEHFRDHVRFSFATNEATLDEAARRIARAVRCIV